MQLNFKKFGESGQTIVILHGVFGFLDNWLTIGKTISDHNYQVYLVDQRNHGRSPHEGSLDYQTFAQDLKEFLEQQKIDRPVLLGHSMGGKTVMKYATMFPEAFSKLVVADIAPKAYRIHHTKILKGLNQIPLNEIENRQEADQILAEYEPIPAVRQFLLKNLYRKDEGGFGWRFNLPLLTENMTNVGEAIESPKPVEAPTLFLRGDRSDYILDKDWGDILKIFPNATLETITNSGHWVHAEQPKAFVEKLIGFVG